MKKEAYIIIAIASFIIGLAAYFSIKRSKGVVGLFAKKDPAQAAKNLSTCNFPIAEGNYVPCELVMNLQRYLNTFPTVGFPLVVDGIWGPKTTDAMSARGFPSPKGPLGMSEYNTIMNPALIM